MRISSNQITSRASAEMMQRQVDIAKYQEQITTGKRVNDPSDDPAAAGQLLGLEEATSRLEQFNRNSIAAESRLGLEETAIASASETLMRIRELALSANSGAVDDVARSAIEAELVQLSDELYNTANIRDANGDFLFSGSNVSTKPFHRQVPVNYAGSDENNHLSIGLGRQIQLGDSGADVFQRVRNGNGTFQTSMASANTGNAIVSAGSVTDLSNYSNSQFEITFTSPTTFDINDTDTGTVLQSGLNYQSGEAIEFEGHSINITGEPDTGDAFVIRPSENQDIFSMVNDFTLAMQNSPVTSAEKANQQQSFNSVLVNLDQALSHLSTKRSAVGARLNTIDSARNENEAVNIQLNQTVSDLENADLTDSVIQLQNNINSLEALQQSYARVENMSLFNFI